jgi:hypothetical protein
LFSGGDVQRVKIPNPKIPNPKKIPNQKSQQYVPSRRDLNLGVSLAFDHWRLGFLTGSFCGLTLCLARLRPGHERPSAFISGFFCSFFQ